MQGLAQHGQHALALPDATQQAQLLAVLLERGVVVHQTGQLGQRQGQRGGGQRGARGAVVRRVSHGLQPQQQISGLDAGQHRVLVRQVDGGHAALAQRMTHGVGLAGVAHQHGDIGRAQGLEAAALPALHKAGLGVVEQAHDVLGAVLRKRRLGRALVADLRGVADGERGHGTGRADQAFSPALSSHRHKGQRIVSVMPEPERAHAGTHLGLLEQAVDHRHQRRGGAKIGAQHAVPAGGGAAGGQVAADVSAAKRVDRLLGVADQEQRGGEVVGGGAVQRIKNAELPRRAVLKLIDQRHRVLGHDALAQPRRVGPGQRHIQPLQHVGKAVHT